MLDWERKAICPFTRLGVESRGRQSAISLNWGVKLSNGRQPVISLDWGVELAKGNLPFRSTMDVKKFDIDVDLLDKDFNPLDTSVKK